ncbi:MAG: 50S ribosomal protein L23 [Candidatus Aureabacteria bacterium]|nr:50S ribosomal protein L23 [Candidatus Auribacterota bacterium]
MDTFEIIKEPVISEKATDLNEKLNQVVFKVDRRANKFQIKAAIEKLYPKVKVSAVRTINMPWKKKRVRMQLGRTVLWKKAVVKLKEGSKIDFQ